MRVYTPRIRLERLTAALPRHLDIILRYLRACEFIGRRPTLAGLVALMRSECRKGA